MNDAHTHPHRCEIANTHSSCSRRSLRHIVRRAHVPSVLESSMSRLALFSVYMCAPAEHLISLSAYVELHVHTEKENILIR